MMNQQTLDKQKYLSTVVDGYGEIAVDDDPWRIGKQSEYDLVKERVRELCIQEGQDYYFCKLAMALAKYDYYGGPCDWNPIHNHFKEKTICEWCDWVINNKDKYEHEIYQILMDYDSDLIPDAFSLMIDYFC